MDLIITFLETAVFCAIFVKMLYFHFLFSALGPLETQIADEILSTM